MKQLSFATMLGGGGSGGGVLLEVGTIRTPHIIGEPAIVDYTPVLR